MKILYNICLTIVLITVVVLSSGSAFTTVLPTTPRIYATTIIGAPSRSHHVIDVASRQCPTGQKRNVHGICRKTI